MALTKRKPKGSPLRKGDKVIATRDLNGVPEGTTGKVKLVNGLFRPGSWERFWVFFNNGVDLGSVDGQSLVRASEWADFQQDRASGANDTSTFVVGADDAAATVSPTSAAPAAAGGSRVPEHLLERTRSRRQALGL